MARNRKKQKAKKGKQQTKQQLKVKELSSIELLKLAKQKEKEEKFIEQNRQEYFDKQRDKAVSDLYVDAAKIADDMADFKHTALTLMKKLRIEKERVYKGEENIKEGNVAYTATHSNNLVLVKLYYQDIKEITDEGKTILESIKLIIVNKFKDNELACDIINTLIRTKKGNDSTQAIARLKEIVKKTDDFEVEKKFELLQEKIIVTGQREYITVQTRNNISEKFERLELNLSSIQITEIE